MGQRIPQLPRNPTRHDVLAFRADLVQRLKANPVYRVLVWLKLQKPVSDHPPEWLES